MGSRPLSTKNTGTKAQVALQNTKRAFMHKYNKTGVNRCKYIKVTTIQCTQTHTILHVLNLVVLAISFINFIAKISTRN